MKRRYENSTRGLFWEVEVVDEETLAVTAGPLGGPGTRNVVDLTEVSGPPINFLIPEMVAELPAGYQEVMPDDLLARVERAHEVTLAGRVREFYATGEYKQHQGKLCPPLACKVDFLAMVVQYQFDQEYYDAAAGRPITLVPLSSKWTGEAFGYEDEQQWIGFDPSLPDGPIFELYTSGSYEEAFATLDEFLASLRPV